MFNETGGNENWEWNNVQLGVNHGAMDVETIRYGVMGIQQYAYDNKIQPIGIMRKWPL